MTIEASSTPNVTRSGSSSESRGARGKPNSGSDDGGGGFMAVLASVETPDANAVPASTPSDTTASLNQGKTPGGTAQPKGKVSAPAREDAAGDASRTKDPVAAQEASATATMDATVEAPGLEDVLPVDTGAAAAASAAAALALLQGTAVGAASSEPLSGVELLAQSMAWTGGVPAAGQGGGAAPLDGSPVPVGQGTATAGVVAGVTPGSVGTRAPVAGQGVPSASAQAPVAFTEPWSESLQKTVKDVPDAQPKAPATGALPEPAAAPESKTAALGNPKWMDSHLAPLATALANANAGASVVAPLQREELPRERSVFRSSSSDSAVAPQAPSTPAPTTTVSGAPEVIAATDAFVAEKVSYWITNNIQNAEMKLEGVGERPVEVSIRMQGNEAQVAFRTDELQTRAALESASAHLKDLLQKEGLVLSGVSVGTAGAGGSGPQDRKSRQGERQATVTTLQPLTGDPRAISNRVTTGGLDLFV